MMHLRNQVLRAVPPVATKNHYKPFAARLQRQVREQAGRRPWRKALRVFLAENEDYRKYGRPRLTAWVVADNAINSLWAGSVLGGFHRIAMMTCPQISRIVFTCPTDARTGYAPRIVWKSNRRAPEKRRVWFSELRDFEVFLNSAALEPVATRNSQITNVDILAQINCSPTIQWEAIVQFVKHAGAQRYLDCSVDEALLILDLSRTIMPYSPDGTNMLTRWRAIRMLAEKDRLNGYIGRQRPLRPFGTAARPEEILDLVSTAFGRSRQELASPRRTAELIHPRYFAAAVIRRATSRTLVEIASLLGGRDHATILNGLDRIDNWTDMDPIHGKLLDAFVQLGDNLGLMKQKEFRLMAISEIESLHEMMRGTTEIADGFDGRHHAGRVAPEGEQQPGPRSRVVSLGAMREDRANSGGTM